MCRTVGSHRFIDAMTSPVKTRFRACAALGMATGCRALRPGLPESLPFAFAAFKLNSLSKGDNRPARSVSHLLEVIERLEESAAHFRSLRSPSTLRRPRACIPSRSSAQSRSSNVR